MKDKLETAQHEAAHIVVGVSLGLRLHSSRIIQRPGETWGGYAWFPAGSIRKKEALALMYAAGVAWERAVANRPSPSDEKLVRGLVSGRHGVETCVRAAGALLTQLGPIHARVTRALLDRDLTGADIAAIARGERLSGD